MRAAREGAGADVGLMIDVGLCWDLAMALERAQALAEFDLYWLEAPMPHEPVSAYAGALCPQSDPHLLREPRRVLGELTLHSRGRLHVILPDVSNVGGIAQWKRSPKRRRPKERGACPTASAPGFWRGVAPPPRQPADGAADRVVDGGLATQHLADRPAMQMVDGYVEVPCGPGLGIELDWTVVERFGSVDSVSGNVPRHP